MCVANMIKVVPIAIRYSAVRRQFGGSEDHPEELPVIEYQLQQFRLFPYLAGTYVLKVFGDLFYQEFVHHVVASFGDGDKELAGKRGAEIQ